MNKIYKLVYSQTLNSLVAVSELASNAQAGKSSKVEISEQDLVASKSGKANLNKLALTFVLSSLFSALPLSASANTGSNVEKVELGTPVTATVNNDVTQDTHFNFESKAGYSASNAGVVADQANGPTVNYVNNVPVVNIVKANAAGVSDNRFKQFSSDTGVYFNNIKNGSEAVNVTALHQKIAANPNLAEAARTIIAQVTGNDKSVIEGTMGVLGQKADLLLINANGIDLNGVNLVNMKDFTATTGELDRATNNLHVTGGELNVNGALTTSDVDTIKLIAAAIKVKAQISAKTANGKKPNIILAGGKQDYNLNTDTATANGQSSADKVVITGSALGSMYGNKVNFVVSESGAGVNYDGLVIGEDDLQITADGQIKVKNTYSTKDTVITSKSGNIQVGDTGSSSVKARGSITLTARSINSNQGTLHAGEAVHVDATELLNVGNVEADTVDLTSARGIVTATDTKIKANTLNVKAPMLARFNGKVTANKEFNVDLNSPTLADNATDADIRLAKTAFRSILQFNDEVTVSGTANLKASRVEFKGKHAALDTDDTVANSEFKFANLNLLVNDISNKAPVSLTNGKLVVNNFGLEVFAPENISTNPLVSTDHGRFSVYQTATLSLKSGNKLASVNSNEAFNHIIDTFNTLHATYGKVKAGDVAVSHDVEYDRGLAFDVTNFTNTGIISTGNSFSVVASNKIQNAGLLFVNGNLLLNAAKSLDLSGQVYTYANLDMKAPHIDQSGQLHVGGNLDVQADSWKLTSRFSGSPTIDLGDKVYGSSWHHHALRKDLYQLEYATGKISTNDITFNVAETNVRGNIRVQKFNPADTTVDTDNSRLTIENGRIVAGGKFDVDGSVAVRTTTFKVPIESLLRTAYPIKLHFQAVSLINTYLSRKSEQTFSSLYDFLEKLETDTYVHHQGAYSIQRQQVLNVFKQATAGDAVLSQVLSSVFGANWRDLDVADFANKFRLFQNNPEKYNIAVFAPDSEVMSLGAFTQSNGKLFVGSDLTGQTIKEVNRKVPGLSTFIQVKGSSDVLLAQKMSSAKTFDMYFNNMGSLIVHKDGKFKLAHDIKWENLADVTATAPANMRDHLVADNGALSMLLAEQYKDRVGGYLIAGKATGDVVREILATNAKYNQALDSLKVNDDGSATIVVDGVTKPFETSGDAVYYLKDNFDHINWIEGEEGLFVPELVVAHKTVLKSTNFDEVAASLSSAKSITTVNNSGVKVNYGSLNTRVLNLDSNGNIELTGLNGQNVINADETHITTRGNLTSIGNMRAGDLTIDAVGDVDLSALSFYTDEGDLANQGKITANDASIKGSNVNLHAVDVIAKGDISVVADKNINMTSAHDEASRFNSIATDTEDSGRQISQSAQFVHGTSLEGENIHVEAGDALNIESSKIKATEQGTLKGNTVTTTAKADVKHVHAVEEKNQFIMTAQAQFGSSSAGIAAQLLDNRDVVGDLDSKTTTWATTDDNVSKAGSGTASSGAELHKQTTTYDTVTVTHVNSELNAHNLTIEATGNAELGNTNINNDGLTVSSDDMKKTATIKAASVTQNNAKDEALIKTKKVEWTAGASSYVSSSVADMASHVVSVARAKSQGKKVDTTFAATVVGDVVGLATRDLASVGSKATFGYSKKETETHTKVDSRNTLAGTVNIETTGNVQLKAVDAKLKDLNVKAKNFTVEGGVSETHEKDSSTSFTGSVDASLGVGITGASGSVSVSFGFSKTHGSSEALTHQNSELQAENANIQVADTVTLKSANIDASNEVNVEAKTVNVISEADKFASESTGISATASVGTTMMGAVLPFGSAGISYEGHVAETHKVAHQSGISADKVHVKAVAVNLEAGKLDAKTSGNIEAKTITSKDVSETNEADGGRFGLTLGINANGDTIGDLNGGRDEQTHYAATLHSGISSSIEVATPKENVTGDTLVRSADTEKLRDVTKDVKVQGTSVDITISPAALKNIAKTVKKATKRVAASVENAKGAIKGYFEGYGDVIKDTLNTQDSSQSTASSIVSTTKYNTGTSNINNPYTGYSKGSSSNMGYNSDFHNGYATSSYSPESYGHSYTTGYSLGGYSGIYDHSLALNSNSVNTESTSAGIHSSAVEVSHFNVDRDDLSGNSKVHSDLKNEADQAVRDVRFTDLLASANPINDLTHVNIDGINIAGSDIGFESQGSSHDFNFDHSSMLDTGSDTGLGKIIGSVDHGIDLTAGGTSSVVNPDVTGGQTGGHGVGTGTGSVLAGSTMNTGTNTGTSSSDTGSSHVDSGVTSGTTSFGVVHTPSASGTSSTVDYSHAGNDFDLDFGSSAYPVTTPTAPTLAGGATTLQPTVSGNTNPVITGTTPSSTSSSIGVHSDTTVNNDVNNGFSNDSTHSTSHSTSSDTTVSTVTGSSSVLAGADNTNSGSGLATVETRDKTVTATTDGVSSTSTTTKVVNKGTSNSLAHQDQELAQTATPADGNAANGQDIKVGDNAKVTKYQIGNLSCYVMSATQAGAAHVADAIREGSAALSQVKDGAGFEKFLKETIRPRATLFSTYSKGIEDALGQSGVICVPTQSEVLKTDYNVIQARNDIPIIKSLSKNDDLEAVVVTERHVRKVRVLANASSATRKVVYEPTNIKVKEVTEIKQTLASKGIDSNKIMILGVKSGASNSVAEMIKNTVGSGPASFDSSSLKTN